MTIKVGDRLPEGTLQEFIEVETAGCSLGPLVDYVTVDLGALRGRTKRVLVHELGHACGLPHSRLVENLMLPRRMGDRLESWQVAVLRSSRHVTYR